MSSPDVELSLTNTKKRKANDNLVETRDAVGDEQDDDMLDLLPIKMSFNDTQGKQDDDDYDDKQKISAIMENATLDNVASCGGALDDHAFNEDQNSDADMDNKDPVDNKDTGSIDNANRNESSKDDESSVNSDSSSDDDNKADSSDQATNPSARIRMDVQTLLSRNFDLHEMRFQQLQDPALICQTMSKFLSVPNLQACALRVLREKILSASQNDKHRLAAIVEQLRNTNCISLIFQSMSIHQLQPSVQQEACTLLVVIGSFLDSATPLQTTTTSNNDGSNGDNDNDNDNDVITHTTSATEIELCLSSIASAMRGCIDSIGTQHIACGAIKAMVLGHHNTTAVFESVCRHGCHELVLDAIAKHSKSKLVSEKGLTAWTAFLSFVSNDEWPFTNVVSGKLVSVVNASMRMFVDSGAIQKAGCAIIDRMARLPRSEQIHTSTITAALSASTTLVQPPHTSPPTAMSPATRPATSTSFDTMCAVTLLCTTLRHHHNNATLCLAAFEALNHIQFPRQTQRAIADANGISVILACLTRSGSVESFSNNRVDIDAAGGEMSGGLDTRSEKRRVALAMMALCAVVKRNLECQQRVCNTGVFLTLQTLLLQHHNSPFIVSLVLYTLFRITSSCVMGQNSFRREDGFSILQIALENHANNHRVIEVACELLKAATLNNRENEDGVCVAGCYTALARIFEANFYTSPKILTVITRAVREMIQGNINNNNNNNNSNNNNNTTTITNNSYLGYNTISNTNIVSNNISNNINNVKMMECVCRDGLLMSLLRCVSHHTPTLIQQQQRQQREHELQTQEQLQQQTLLLQQQQQQQQQETQQTPKRKKIKMPDSTESQLNSNDSNTNTNTNIVSTSDGNANDTSNDANDDIIDDYSHVIDTAVAQMPSSRIGVYQQINLLVREALDLLLLIASSKNGKRFWSIHNGTTCLLDLACDLEATSLHFARGLKLLRVLANGSEKDQEEIKKSQLIPKSIRMLTQEPLPSTTVLTCLLCLMDQCFTANVHQQRQLVALGIFPAISHLLQNIPTNQSIVGSCCGLAWGLVRKCSDIKEAVSRGVFRELVTAASFHLTVPQVQQPMCGLFAELATQFQEPSFCGLTQVDAVTYVIKAMTTHPKEVGVQLEGCAALWNICRIGFESKEVVRKSGAIGVVGRAMNLHYASQELQCNACGVLVQLTKEDIVPRCVDELKREKIVPLVTTCVGMHTHNITLMHLVSATLGNIATHPMAKPLAKDPAGCSTLINCLDKHPNDSSIIRHLCQVLTVCHNELDLLESGCLATCTRALNLHLDNEKIVSVVVRLIGTAVQCPSPVPAHVLVPSVVNDVFDALSKLCSSLSPRSQEIAVKVILLLAKHPDFRPILSVTGEVRALLTRAQHSTHRTIISRTILEVLSLCPDTT